ncbi:haloacid dehalogenase type II [Rhodobacteraceae bacterium NNCM2]|nr:haloacid dehalogenase type II [Coraliihabitans acroporae]
MTITTCVFDAYGTLFDVAAAAREAAAEPGFEELADKWIAVADIWRQKQLQYTWLRAAGGVHTDFWKVTADGLDYALEAAGIDSPKLRERLLQLYWELSAYPEVPKMLKALKEAGKNTAILSNGSPAMLNGAVESAKIGDVLDAVLSVETVGAFKPAKPVYDLIGTHFGVPQCEVLFVSSNCWDACFAAAQGFTVAWANRKAEPLDRLPFKPHHVLSDLTSIPKIAGAK